MTALQLEHLLIIENTNRYMAISAQRETAHGDIVGDGELALMLDDLRALLDRIGVKAEEVGNRLRSALDTQEDMPAVILYDEDGNELDTAERSA